MSQVSQPSDSLTLDKSHYIRDVSAKFKQEHAHPVTSPASTSGCLGSAEPGDSPRSRIHTYMSLLGSLLWVTLTRPDVATVVNRACSHGSAPTMTHWRVVIRILRYYHLVCTSERGLTYVISVRPTVVSTFTDAAFANEIARRSRYGFAVFLGACLISWVSKCTTIMVCLSTSEAEFVAVTEAVKDIIWIRGLLKELGLLPDSASACCLRR